jgi:ribonuclease HI
MGPQVEVVKPRDDVRSRGAFTITSRDDAKRKACSERLPGELKMYTDGSRNSKGYVGAGWCWKPTEDEFVNGLTEYWEETGEGFEGSYAGLGKRCEVYDAELFAIYRALKEAYRLRSDRMPSLKRLTIFSDSQAALRRLMRDEESPGQAITRCIWRWEESLSGVDIEYVWVPGHEGVPGNEIADTFAKRGAEMESAHLFENDSKAQWMTYSLSHLHRECTEKYKSVAKEWIKGKLQHHKLFRPRKTWVFRPALKPP